MARESRTFKKNLNLTYSHAEGWTLELSAEKVPQLLYDNITKRN